MIGFPGIGPVGGGGLITYPTADLLLLLSQSAGTGGFSRIIYNNKAVDFPAGPQTLDIYNGTPKSTVRARSGVSETLFVPRHDCNVEAEFLHHRDLDLEMALRCWWAWAEQGLPWFFALDAAKTVLTTLSATATAGDSTLTLTSTTGLTANERYLVRYAGNYQIVKVTAINSNIVTLSGSIDFNFPAGSLFRTEYFWAGTLLEEYGVDDPIEIIPAPEGFHFTLKFTEDLN